MRRWAHPGKSVVSAARRRAVVLAVVVLGACLAGPANAQDAATDRVERALRMTELRDKAIAILVEASRSDNAALRSNAIEAMQMQPERARPLIQRGLDDPNPAVRFAAVVAAGRLGFDAMRPALRPLVHDTHPSVRAAAMYALRKLGERIDVTPLADMLASQDPGLRANVALILGLMGDDSAIPMLRQAGGWPMPKVSEQRVAVVRIQIAEAMARLGDEGALTSLRAGIHSSIGEVRVVAINAIGELGDEKGAAMLQVLLDRQPVEVRLAAAGALARVARKQQFEHRQVGQWLGELVDRARPIVLEAGRSQTMPHRAQAAWVLGWFDDAATMQRVRELIAAEQGPVRVAAAASALRRALRELGGSAGPDS